MDQRGFVEVLLGGIGVEPLPNLAFCNAEWPRPIKIENIATAYEDLSRANVGYSINPYAPNIARHLVKLPHSRRADIPTDVDGPVLVGNDLIAKGFGSGDSARSGDKPPGCCLR